MSKKTTNVPPRVFQTRYDETTLFPFFETEDATIIGAGHHDKEAFAARVTEYDRLMADGFETRPDQVEWKYATVKRRKTPDNPEGEWWFTWSKDGVNVTATTPGAIAITLVIR